MVKRNLCAFLLALSLVSFLAPGAAVAQKEEPSRLQALSLVAPSCSPLILPPATTREQRLLNRQARREFLAIRESLATEPAVCAVPTTDEPAGTDSAFEASTVVAAVKTCGDCPSCLSAASCSDCAVGSVCSPPGAIPTRACRAVGSCTNWLGQTTYCCGCS